MGTSNSRRCPMVATQLETKPLVKVQPHPLWDVEEPNP